MCLNHYQKYTFREPYTIPVFYNDSAITINVTHCNPENPDESSNKYAFRLLDPSMNASHKNVP